MVPEVLECCLCDYSCQNNADLELHIVDKHNYIFKIDSNKNRNQEEQIKFSFLDSKSEEQLSIIKPIEQPSNTEYLKSEKRKISDCKINLENSSNLDLVMQETESLKEVLKTNHLVIMEGIKCFNCNFLATSTILLKHHGCKVPHSGDQTQNINKSKRYKIRSTLYRHKKTANHDTDSNIYYVCQECDKVFADPESLDDHVQAVHEEEERFDWESGLRHRSEVGHQQIGDFPCQHCWKIFKRMASLKKHTVKVHSTMEKQFLISRRREIFRCSKCAKKFYTKYDRCQHKKEKHPELLFPCFECPKKLPSKYALQYHIERIHRGDPSYVCQFCNKMSSSKAHLKEHIRIIHVEKKWNCKFCPDKFDFSERLKDHYESVHKKWMNFKCNPCKKFYTTKSDWSVHEKRTHGEWKWKCWKCGKACPQRNKLRVHLENVHKMAREEIELFINL